MTIARKFKVTIQARAARNPEFREGLLRESIECMIAGDLATGKSILRDYINATIGFEKLAQITGKEDKSLMRMLSAAGNPTARNLFEIIHLLQKKEGVHYELHTASGQ